VKIPTQEELDAVIQAFDESWGAVDEVLYRACREHPLHNDRRAIMCKMVVVGRCYAAGIERLVTPRKGEQAVDRIGDCLARHGAVIDGIIQGLPDPEAPLTPAPMRIVVRQHGRLTRLLARHLTKGRYPTSFVSKYLHFHRPIVPIYDAYCLAGLTKAVHWDQKEIPFGPPGRADRGYYQFCARFMRLHEACRDAGLAPSVKDLDAWLWQVPK